MSATKNSRWLVTVLLVVVLGCQARPQVEIPENPAPPPEKETKSRHSATAEPSATQRFGR
jgi:hypothetical protein